MDDLTVLIPVKKGARKDWLDEAIGSIPAGVRYIVLENDNELAAALNTGLEAATTEYVVRLDADDMLDEKSVRLQVDACWDVDVAYPSLFHLTEDATGSAGLFNPGEFCANRLEVWNYIPGQGAVMRRRSVIDAGGYRDLPALEDWDLWVRMARRGCRFKWVTEALYVYRSVEGSRNKMTGAQAQELKRQIVGDEPDLIATFYAQETVATSYWRCVLPSRVMPAQTCKHRPQVDVTEDGNGFSFPHHRGAAIWQFPGHEYERQMMAAMQEFGIPCLVEVDDNYLVKAKTTHDAWKPEPPKRGEDGIWPAYSTHRKIVGWADGVIVTTEHLGKQYRKATDAPIFVCPNQIDPSDWRDELPLPDWYDPDRTYVGVAASASHMDDMQLVGRALDWASRQRGVEVVVFGIAPPRAGLKFRHVPWTTDMAVLRAMMRVLDVGLAPVRDNVWASCRSDVKALEYLMAGAVPVLSSAVPYKDWADGDGCRKASTPEQFLRATQDLVYRADERRDLAARGRAYVLGERTMEANAHRWREACDVKLREAIAA